jgi:hypothetical protein
MLCCGGAQEHHLPDPFDALIIGHPLDGILGAAVEIWMSAARGQRGSIPLD